MKQLKILLQLINCLWEDYNKKPSEKFFFETGVK